jgi:hypothetical protein
MSKKDQCKEIMGKLFGPNTAKLVERMDEKTVVETCKKKVIALLGAEKAKLFDHIS